MSVEIVAKNSCSTVGEGPHWEPETQTLIYVDIASGDVHRYNPSTKTDVKVHVGGTIGFIVPREKGDYVIGHNKTVALLDWDTAKTEVFAKVDEGLNTRFNDGKCDSKGRLWAGTMDIQLDLQQGSLYHMNENRQISKRLSPVDISNGLAWNLDNTVMYYIDSIPRKVYAFDFDSATGNITNQRVAVDFGGEETMADMGNPDGMCIDNEGMIWVACFHGSKVIRFNPNTGERLRDVTFPCKRINSCCFGGANLDELYVTSSCYKLPDDELKEFPLAGSLFKVTGLGVRGIPVPGYSG